MPMLLESLVQTSYPTGSNECQGQLCLSKSFCVGSIQRYPSSICVWAVLSRQLRLCTSWTQTAAIGQPQVSAVAAAAPLPRSALLRQIKPSLARGCYSILCRCKRVSAVPNPSIERTSTGLARFTSLVHVPLRGPIRFRPLMSNVRLAPERRPRETPGGPQKKENEAEETRGRPHEGKRRSPTGDPHNDSNNHS